MTNDSLVHRRINHLLSQRPRIIEVANEFAHIRGQLSAHMCNVFSTIELLKNSKKGTAKQRVELLERVLKEVANIAEDALQLSSGCSSVLTHILSTSDELYENYDKDDGSFQHYLCNLQIGVNNEK